MKIIKLKKTVSTELYIRKYLKKQCAAREALAVISDVQTGGKGSKGRSFISPYGGLYMSVIYFHNGLLAKDAFKITQSASLAVVNTLKAFGISSGIKWPNDIFVAGKKICGMLITNSFCGDYADYTIIGIGINVNNDLPAELNDIAVSMKQILNNDTDVSTVAATLLYNLLNPQDVGLYADYSVILGKEIRAVLPNGKSFTAVAEEILPDGRLKLSTGDALSAAEVTLKSV